MTENNIPQERRCKKCNLVFPLSPDYFVKCPDCNYGVSHMCKECCTKKARDWREQNPERARDLNHRMYTNKREVHLEQGKKWAKDNPEKARAIKQRWADNNPERKRETGRNYARRNPLKRVEWRKNNLAAYRANNKKSLAKRRALMAQMEGHHTKEDLIRIYEEQERRCAYCGITLYWDIPGDIHLDHVVALTRGGSNWPDNLALACASCNSSKQDKSVEEWLATRGW